MSTTAAKKFTATLEPDGTQLRWIIARVPFDIAKAWPHLNRRRVRGDIEGFEFRTSLFPNPHGTGHILLVNKKMQAAAKARPGSKVRITLQPDLKERPTFIPPELAAELKSDRKLRSFFDALSPSMRREIGKWADEPKSPETRRKRAEKLAERLFLAMEGEKAPPPILRVAFSVSPGPSQVGTRLPRLSDAIICSGSFITRMSKPANAAPQKLLKTPCGPPRKFQGGYRQKIFQNESVIRSVSSP